MDSFRCKCLLSVPIPIKDFDQFAAVLRSHGLHLPELQVRLLASYCLLLWEWNSRLNLTRHTDWQLFVTRDLLDTLELAGHVPQGSAVLDVGSGGGVPGIPLAILRPDLRVSLSESVGKKAKALTAMVNELKLTVPVYTDRAEVILKTRRFDCVTARAVASISRMLVWFQPVWSSIDQLLIIKGPRWAEEYDEARQAGLLQGLTLEQIASWSTPGRDGKSVLLRITEQSRDRRIGQADR